MTLSTLSKAIAQLDLRRGFIASPAAVIVRILLGEQLLTAIVGIAGGLWPAQSALLLHLLIVGQLLLDGVAFLLLFRLSGLKLGRPRIFALCFGGLMIAAIVKNLHVSWSSAAIDFIRLVVPLLWLALTPVEGFAKDFLDQVRQVRYILVAVLAAQVIGLAVGRLEGWGAAYLSGDPLIGLLIFPAMIEGSDLVGQIVVVLLVVPLLIVSLKRTAWLSAIVVIILLAVGSWRSISRRTLTRVAIVAFVGLVMAFGITYASGAGTGVVKRAESVTTIAANSGSDYSFEQRIQEITTEVARVRANPLPSLLFGLSSQEVRLPNGQMTHAIHATPLFLLFGGGLLWLLAFAVAGRQGQAGASPAMWLLAFVAVGTFLDSLGGNTALAPSFGLALAILRLQVIRLTRRRESVGPG
jgi:hypothetical protein